MSARDTHPSPSRDADDITAPRRGVLLLDIEPAMASLLEEWLARDGWPVRVAAAAPDAVALIVIELAFPRQDSARLQQARRDWPGVPLLVLSPTFLAGVAPQGEVARQLGAAAVLPAPVSRDTLCAAVARALGTR